MEKNTTKYILGAAVFSIWGLLLYRVYSKMKPENDWRPTHQEVIVSKNQNVVDSFTLSLDYDSPFRVVKGSSVSRALADNSSPTKSNSTNRNLATRKVKKKAKPKSIPFPNVSYKGNISSKNGRTIALVKIDNQIMNLGKGETFRKVLLQKIYEDSIKVSFAGRDSVIMKGD